MQIKLALVLPTVLAAAQVIEGPRFTQVPAAHDSDDFLRRCPLRMGGERRIDAFLKLMTCCNRDEMPPYDDFPGNTEWVWGELDLGRCFGNDNGQVVSQHLGNMQQTCSECHFEGKTTNMICTCKNKAGDWVDSEMEIGGLFKVKKDGVVCCKEFEDVCGKLFDPDEWDVPTPSPAWDLGPY